MANNNPTRVYQKYLLDNSSNIPIECKQSFSNIINNDYPNKQYGFSDRILDTLCINIDLIEIKNNGDNDETMDMVIGIGDFDISKRKFSNKRFLPVELKLGCMSGSSISKKNLIDKNKHTRDLLNGKFQIDSKSVFLFTNNIASVIKNKKSRWEKETNGGIIKNLEIMTPEEYNSYIQFEEDYPYSPKTNIIELKDCIKSSFERGGIDELMKIIDHYVAIANKYGLNEYNVVIEALKDSIVLLMDEIEDSNDKEYLSMLKDEIF